MGLESFWQFLGLFTVAATTIAAFVAWRIKSTITLWFTKDLEDYKSKLALESSVQVESLKTRLQLTAKQHEIVFTHLYQKRAEIIAELNKLLREFLSTLIYFEAEVKNVERNLSSDEFLAKLAELIRSWGKINDYIFENDMYLGDALSCKVMDMSGTKPYWLRHKNITECRASLDTTQTENERKQLKQAIELTKREFQRLIGIQSYCFGETVDNST